MLLTLKRLLQKLRLAKPENFKELSLELDVLLQDSLGTRAGECAGTRRDTRGRRPGKGFAVEDARRGGRERGGVFMSPAFFLGRRFFSGWGRGF